MKNILVLPFKLALILCIAFLFVFSGYFLESYLILSGEVSIPSIFIHIFKGSLPISILCCIFFYFIVNKKNRINKIISYIIIYSFCFICFYFILPIFYFENTDNFNKNSVKVVTENEFIFKKNGEIGYYDSLNKIYIVHREKDKKVIPGFVIDNFTLNENYVSTAADESNFMNVLLNLFSDISNFNADLERRYKKDKDDFTILIVLLIGVCLSGSVLTRITSWKLFNLLISLIFLRAILFLYAFSSGNYNEKALNFLSKFISPIQFLYVIFFSFIVIFISMDLMIFFRRKISK